MKRAASRIPAFVLVLGLAAAPLPAHAGFMDFVKKVFKIAKTGSVTIPLKGSYPLGPTPLVLRNGSLTLTKSSATVNIDLTATGVPLCAATLFIDASGVSLDCDADFKVFKAHLGGHLAFDFKSWGLDGTASLEVLGHKLAGVHIEVSQEGVRAVFSLLGAELAVGPVTAGEIWGAIKSAALSVINPYELAKRAAHAVADGARAVAAGAKQVAAKVGSALSSAASSLLNNGGLRDSIKDILKKKVAEANAKKAAEARAAKAKLDAMCEALAGRIVSDAGLDKAPAAALTDPMAKLMRTPPFNCEVAGKVLVIVTKVRLALAAVSTINAKMVDALKPLKALEEANKLGLVKFYTCAVKKKEAACAGLWPHLDAKMRALAEKLASKPAPQRRTYRRANGAPASNNVNGAKNANAAKAAKTAEPLPEAPAASPSEEEAQVPAVKPAAKQKTATFRMTEGPLPMTLRLAEALGFRTRPSVNAPFVFAKEKYVEALDHVKIVDVVGEPGTPGCFCKVSRKGKLGYIRCDGAFFRK